MLAATVRVTRDLDLAEECVQDAYAAALTEWARDGVPDRPAAWLTTAARHNALDVLRRAATLRAKPPLLVEPAPDGRWPTTRCGLCSCAATPRCRPRRRWR
ncbi:sigma factor [Amycolatopsis methanolica]|uniref:sigma factor n=1 Tax=Amycolatopsis methanolica TaxID=1814 RepID=UPI002B3FFE28|nr:sigma factor [Amycolatopsis methanolica]